MHTRIVWLSMLGIGLCLGWATGLHSADRVLAVYPVEGIINPIITEYLTESIRHAQEAQAVAVVFQLDTPGGLVETTREIVKVLLNAPLPVVVYVAPSGARAASAGTFITMAAHIAAMAPGTNIGAAHPVTGEGKNIEGDMRQKAENDLAAFARSIADARHRNAEWAEKAVRESLAITEKEAQERQVIDLVAEDLPDLVRKLDGRQVTLPHATVTLHTTDVTLRYGQMSWRQRFLASLAHPQIALMLLSLGSVGLLVELYNPGLIFPGVVGALALLLAFYSLQTLPINYVGLGLIGLAMLMFILEVKITSFGMLTLGGLVAMVLGALMLVDTPEEFLRIPLATIVLVVGTTAALLLIVVGAAVQTVGRKPVSGQEGMLGALGVVRVPLHPTGTVFVQGALWSAQSSTPIAVGETVRVIGVHGLKLTVEKVVKEA